MKHILAAMIFFSSRLVSKGLYIYFLFNDAETQLLKISVGPDKRSANDSL
jgi:hypothetical protein